MSFYDIMERAGSRRRNGCRDASLTFIEKHHFDDGATLELAIYAVPTPVPGSKHRLKYSLFYGKDGKRLICYDNEKPKGDHRHYGSREMPYKFSTVERLISEFPG